MTDYVDKIIYKGKELPIQDSRIPEPPAEGNFVLVKVDGEIFWKEKE